MILLPSYCMIFYSNAICDPSYSTWERTLSFFWRQSAFLLAKVLLNHTLVSLSHQLLHSDILWSWETSLRLRKPSRYDFLLLLLLLLKLIGESWWLCHAFYSVCLDLVSDKVVLVMIQPDRVLRQSEDQRRFSFLLLARLRLLSCDSGSFGASCLVNFA